MLLALSAGAEFLLSPTGAVIFSVGVVVIYIRTLAVYVRRFHDFGWSAWNLLWFIVPLVNIVMWFVLGLRMGDPEPNKYGLPPGMPAELYGNKGT